MNGKIERPYGSVGPFIGAPGLSCGRLAARCADDLPGASARTDCSNPGAYNTLTSTS